MAVGRVLVVDDNRLMRMLAQASIKSLECEVREAVDGEEGLAVALEFQPDVVLLDVVMPRLDGFEVLARLREDPKLSSCRVVMLTTADSTTDRDQARIHHADAYIVKPFDHHELCDTVAGFLEG